MAKKITEIRQRILKDNQIFECELFRRQTDYLVLRYANPESQGVGDITIPAGSITLAHYRQGASGVWWEMFYSPGSPIGDLIHLSSPIQIRETQVVYTDLLLDIWQVTGEPPRLLDDDELADAVTAGAIPETTAEEIRQTARHIMADLGDYAPPLWHNLDPGAEATG